MPCALCVDATHALGKWDVGFMQKECSPTYRGFDTFFGYYMACEADYWYHGASGGYPGGANCTSQGRHLTCSYLRTRTSACFICGAI